MRISVYITSYNQKHYLIESIESVLNQTLKPFQLIVVDDCSVDGSQDVISGYTSQYPDLITPIYHARNLGVAQTRIDALRAVTGDYVSRVDGDDRFLPAKLEMEAKSLWDNPNAQIAFSDHYFMKEDGVRTGIWAGKKKPPQGYVFRQTFVRDFPRRGLFKRDLVNYKAWMTVGSYDPNLKIYEDYDMCIRLTKRFRVVYCAEALSETRVHQSGLSSAKATQHLAALEYIYQKNKRLLDDLGAFERFDVKRKYSSWMAEIALKAANEELGNAPKQRGDQVQVIKYYIQWLRTQPHSFISSITIIRMLLHHHIHRWLRGVGRLRNLEE